MVCTSVFITRKAYTDSMGFSGNGITVHGYSDLSYSISLDNALAFEGSFASVDSNVLFDKRDLSDGYHNITIVVETDGRKNKKLLALDSAVVEYTHPDRYVSRSEQLLQLVLTVCLFNQSSSPLCACYR
jgi:hypothetical protein